VVLLLKDKIQLMKTIKRYLLEMLAYVPFLVMGGMLVYLAFCLLHFGIAS